MVNRPCGAEMAAERLGADGRLVVQRTFSRYFTILGSSLRTVLQTIAKSVRSRSINNLCTVQDRLFTEIVAARLETTAAHKVYMVADDVRQLLLHAHQIKQSVLSFRLELDQHIHVAVGAKIRSQDDPNRARLRMRC